MKPIEKSMDKITFSIGQRAYSRECIDSIQILHYRQMEEHGDPDGPDDFEEALVPTRSPDYFAYAEVLVFYDEEDAKSTGDVTRSILLCRSFFNLANRCNT
jgi:hypothetical protein